MMKKHWWPHRQGLDRDTQVTRLPPVVRVFGVDPGSPEEEIIKAQFRPQINHFLGVQRRQWQLGISPQQYGTRNYPGINLRYSHQNGLEILEVRVAGDKLKQILEQPSIEIFSRPTWLEFMAHAPSPAQDFNIHGMRVFSPVGEGQTSPYWLNSTNYSIGSPPYQPLAPDPVVLPYSNYMHYKIGGANYGNTLTWNGIALYSAVRQIGYYPLNPYSDSGIVWKGPWNETPPSWALEVEITENYYNGWAIITLADHTAYVLGTLPGPELRQIVTEDLFAETSSSPGVWEQIIIDLDAFHTAYGDLIPLHFAMYASWYQTGTAPIQCRFRAIQGGTWEEAFVGPTDGPYYELGGTSGVDYNIVGEWNYTTNNISRRTFMVVDDITGLPVDEDYFGELLGVIMYNVDRVKTTLPQITFTNPVIAVQEPEF